jgi:hypothetical protein
MMAAVKRRLSGLALVACLSLCLPLTSACSTLFMTPAERELEARNCLEGFVGCFSSEELEASCCVDGEGSMIFVDQKKEILACIKEKHFTERSKIQNFFSVTVPVDYGGFGGGDISFTFSLYYDFTAAAILTDYDEGPFGGCFSASKYYSLDEADGKAIYAAAAAVQAEQESSVSKASSSGEGGSASV